MELGVHTFTRQREQGAVGRRQGNPCQGRRAANPAQSSGQNQLGCLVRRQQGQFSKPSWTLPEILQRVSMAPEL